MAEKLSNTEGLSKKEKARLFNRTNHRKSPHRIIEGMRQGKRGVSLPRSRRKSL